MTFSILKQFILTLLLLTSICSFSANWELADCHLEKATKFIKDKKIDSAIVYFNKAIELRLPIHQAENNNWKAAIEDYTLIGKQLRYFDSKQALHFLQQAIRIGKKNLKDKDSSLFRAYYYQGLIYRDIEKYDLAKDALEKAIDIQELHAPKSKEMAGACKVMGTVFAARSNYPKAFTYFDKAIRLYKDLDNIYKLCKVYYDKATTLRLDKQHYEAIRYLDLALQCSKLSDRDKSIIYREKGRCWLVLGETEKAIQSIQIALDIAKEIGGERLVAYISKILGHAHAQQRNFEKALAAYFGALQLTSKKYQREQANIHQRIGVVYNQILQTDSALHHFQKSLMLLFDDFQSEDIHSNPPAENIYQDPFLLLVLEGKANSFQQRYQQTKNRKDLKSALESYQLALSSVNILVQNYENETAQFSFRSNKYNLFQEALKTAYQLHLLYPENPTYIEQAFNISEKSKAFSLLQKLKKTEAQQLTELPDSLVRQVQKLQQKEEQLNWYLKEDTTNAIYKDSLFKIQREKEQLTAYMENTYPQYRKIKYQDKTVSLKKLQDYLSTNQLFSRRNKALLEYFVGDSTIYAFLITSNHIELQPIPNTTELKQDAACLYTRLQFDRNIPHSEQFDDYTETALKLYKKLFDRNSNTDTINQIQELYIIPDDYLYKIPFEALISKTPNQIQDNDMSYGGLSYLLNTYSISYAYSATLLLQSLQKRKQKPKYKGTLLGFAPSFGGGQSSMRDCVGGILEDLKSGEKEVEVISKIDNAQIYLRTNANKEAFLNEAKHYRILHLSTHACADNTNYENNRIYFADDFLLNRELSTLRLQADLAVLSACLSGRGFLQKGEGVMSLARAFLYAGCPSVVSSLWNVDDKKTSEIMQDFYSNLKEEQSKSNALQNAKLDYIKVQKNNKKCHPFYWAPFIQIGNPNPIVLEEKAWDYWKVLASIIAIISLVYLYARKTN